MADDIVSQWEKEIKARQDHAKAALVALAPQFREAGIAFVVAFYDGEGDSGSINSIQFCGPEENVMEIEPRSEGDVEGTLKCPKLVSPEDESIEIQVEGYTGQTLECYFDEMCPSGYENNEGGFGAVIFDVENGKVRVNHAWRTTDYETQDYDA